jgi:hypothetical protein
MDGFVYGDGAHIGVAGRNWRKFFCQKSLELRMISNTGRVMSVAGVNGDCGGNNDGGDAGGGDGSSGYGIQYSGCWVCVNADGTKTFPGVLPISSYECLLG